jgi:hypothetical protein
LWSFLFFLVNCSLLSFDGNLMCTNNMWTLIQIKQEIVFIVKSYKEKYKAL